MPQSGQVDWIGIRPKKRSDIEEVAEVKISVESGLEGDHYGKKGGKRMITLMQKEHLEVVSNILDAKVNPTSLRRNVVVEGVNLLALHNVRFKIGHDVILEGTGYCHPCSRMEENLGPGGYNAMRGHGGITAKVIQGGMINLGDAVTISDSGG